MRIVQRVSKDLVDHRNRYVGGAAVGVMVALFGIVAVRATGTSEDPDRDLVFVVSTALDRAQDVLAKRIPSYRRASVVLFDRSERTACGRGLATSGPFYCPSDEKIYLDLTFLRAIRGDLARAYVIQHELGHHAQKLRGEIEGRPSVVVELAADCYAGLLMRADRAAGYLDETDIDGALLEAAAVGDDRICPICSPERWSHGSSMQRVAAVSAGLNGADCRP